MDRLPEARGLHPNRVSEVIEPADLDEHVRAEVWRAWLESIDEMRAVLDDPLVVWIRHMVSIRSSFPSLRRVRWRRLTEPRGAS